MVSFSPEYFEGFPAAAPPKVAACAAALEMAAPDGPPWWGRLENRRGKTPADGLSHPLTLLLPASAACAAFDPTGLFAGGAEEPDFSRERS